MSAAFFFQSFKGLTKAFDRGICLHGPIRDTLPNCAILEILSQARCTRLIFLIFMQNYASIAETPLLCTEGIYRISSSHAKGRASRYRTQFRRVDTPKTPYCERCGYR